MDFLSECQSAVKGIYSFEPIVDDFKKERKKSLEDFLRVDPPIPLQVYEFNK